MQITVQGLVIREKNHEEDKILTILTDEYGVINAYAKGAQKLRGKLLGGTEMLCLSHFVLFKSKDKYSVDVAESENNFFKIRQDIEKLSLATYFAQLCSLVAPHEEAAGEYLRLMLNCLHMLAEGKRSQLFLKPLFELRILTMAGYMPNLVACNKCGEFEKDIMYFAPLSGELYCGDCIGDDSEIIRIKIDKSILAAMRYIIYSPFEKLFSFSLPDEALKNLGAISERYLRAQVDTALPTLDFYKSLFIF